MVFNCHVPPCKWCYDAAMEILSVLILIAVTIVISKLVSIDSTLKAIAASLGNQRDFEESIHGDLRGLYRSYRHIHHMD